ncbi:pilus assembly PilX N-terminal domain-containing protein [Pseudoduganella chitinolytica]|uniref:Pilus assembly PilX N-terminal domain-containing protein n=1 Tax=Pseudoduganella chitinolytica TaxID=34070 RepID=A0ABY8BFU7_9BURK|nr:pilus assembly PilX N-terminal domain-containing protein [Pseudoduganella chitinolytica]WEF34782.1 pilus assembly PilX N-terminal domain-containing protein [Pseudoduganella chitinolytica]
MKPSAIVRRRRRSRGVSLVTAIFLLVVLSGIAAAVVTLSTAQHTSSTYDVLGARAYEAARSGVDYGLHDWFTNRRCTNTNLALPATLAGFTVTVQCSQSPMLMADGVTDLQPVRVTATACNQPAAGACPNPAPGPDYVQRVVQATL